MFYKTLSFSFILLWSIIIGKPCLDESTDCFADIGIEGHYPEQCNYTAVRDMCPYMCGECYHKSYSDASVYFNFDELDDSRVQFKGIVGSDTDPVGGGITPIARGRRNGGVSLNGSTCLHLKGLEKQGSCIYDLSGCPGISFSMFFGYELPASVNTNLTFVTSGAHKDHAGIYFGYSKPLNKFMVRIKSQGRQYSAEFTEDVLPTTSRLLINIVVTCNLGKTGVLRDIQDTLHNLHGYNNTNQNSPGLKVYIEGVQILHQTNFTNITLTSDYGEVKIGCINDGENWSKSIRVDEFAFWDRVLPPAEVFEVATANSMKKHEPPPTNQPPYVPVNNLDTATSVITSLDNIVNTKSLTGGDVKELVNMWSRLAAAHYTRIIPLVGLNPAKKINQTETLVSKVGDTINGMFRKTNREAVEDLSDKEPESIANLVESVDNFLGKVSRFTLMDEPGGNLEATEIRDVIEIRVKLDTNSKESYEYEDGLTASLETEYTTNALLVNVLYKGLGNLFPVNHSIALQFNDMESSGTRNKSYLKLSEDIMGMSVYDEHKDIKVNVKYKFKLPQIPETNVYPHCVFLDFTNSSTAEEQRSPFWSDTGCSLLAVDNISVTCSCSHLTNFAILLQIVPFEISKKDREALEVITYIGCTLSILGGILTVTTFIFLRIYTDRVMIHLNLAIAIIGAQVLMLIEESIVRGTSACSAVTILLYYFNMSIFSWMLVEGIQLFLQIVIVFAPESKIKIFYGIGWGAPLIMAIICAVSINDSLGQHGVCWLSPLDYSIWAFAVPALLVIFTNLIILIAVMKVVINLSKTMEKSKMKSVRSAIKASVLLLPLLGCTWLFGVLAVSGSTVIFQYLFALFNSLQGLMLFVCHCVFNTEVRETFMKRKSAIDQIRQIRVQPMACIHKTADSSPHCADVVSDPRYGTETPSTDSCIITSAPGSAKSGHRTF